jgi:hypothetical protein
LAATESGGETMAPSAKTGSPGQRRHHQMRNYADHEGGEEDGADGELQDDAQIGAKIPPGGEPGARHQQRRQKQHEHQLGVDLDIRGARDQCEADTAEDQCSRARELKTPRDHVEQNDDSHQQQDNFEAGNGGHEGLSRCEKNGRTSIRANAVI